MRLATLNTPLEMWNSDLKRYATVPAGTTVQVIKSNSGWTRICAPGGLSVTSPTMHTVRLNYLDEDSPDAASDA